jgi:hypothetical protein
MTLPRSLAIAFLLFAGNAHAQGEDARERVRLDWQRGPGAESCASEAEIGRRVAARLGRDPFQTDAKRTIAARVERGADGWRAQISVLGPDGKPVATREPLRSNAADCSAVSDAAVLSIALAIEPDLMLGPAPASEPPPAPSCPTVICATTSCPACPPPIVTPAPVTKAGPRLRTHARGAVALGVLPAPALGAGLASELEVVPDFALGAGILYFPEVETDDGELAFGLTSFELFGCLDLVDADAAALAGCLELQAGSMHALAQGLRPIDPGDYLWLALGLGPKGRLSPIEGMSLELGALVTTPLVAQEFVVRGQAGTAHEPATIGFFGFVGIGVEVP